MRDRNSTRSLAWQRLRVVITSLKGKDDYGEYLEECDAANPAKTAQSSKIRHTKKEMEEKLPLVDHGLVDAFHTVFPNHAWML